MQLIQLLVRHVVVPDIGANIQRRDKLVEYSAQVPPDLPKQDLLVVLRREHDMLLALPCRVVQAIMIV